MLVDSPVNSGQPLGEDLASTLSHALDMVNKDIRVHVQALLHIAVYPKSSVGQD